MAFKFRYEKVLDKRIVEEDEAKRNLAQKIGDMERISTKLESIKADRVNYEHKMLAQMQSGISANQLSGFNSSKKWYRDEIENYEHLLIEAKNQVSLSRERLIIATQELKKIEKLKEKAFEEYKFLEQKEMNEMIEEVVSFQMARKSE